MRIVFLDIDGVLLPLPQMHEANRVCQELLPSTDGCPEFAASCVAELNWICDIADAKIVISSTWRQHIPSIGTMRSIMCEQGVTAELIGMTPIAQGEWPSHDRGDEVNKFLENITVDSFAIIDDFDMGWAGLENRWVQPDGLSGLQHHDAEVAVAILNSV